MAKTKFQTSETFLVSSILALSGGFQDAYTYSMRNEVFANAQTGNVVLMSWNFMNGDVRAGLSYLFPVIAFALGILAAELVAFLFKKNKRIHWSQLVLIIEMALLFAVGFIDERYNTWATMLVSLACAMQVQSFRKVRGYSYASTMCIGNIRTGTEGLFAFIRKRDKKSLEKFAYYYGIILAFAIGAGLGGVLSMRFGLKTIWASDVLLLSACLIMIKDHMGI